ncbi:hypothetical protein BBBOND_0107280 [Babesia bigemina]|uniref:Uncharacterized protein n=1 Tax=Babesia bigemina TaxID=5866 RepID=A0A061D667_BABBI|nr:hypothetical protein BBBOND_0107280 [Babesia bigemina]CDR94419.1 hypothetical protein BBBOND_0107280 [Babesia bigemina]|eukprot:XP_012766605.1 hypothetical protein BBBOND_0107280 [Babesia bigemina]
MVYKSLTNVPRNFKEAIDWLVALKGTDSEKNLAAIGVALYYFLADMPVGYTNLPALEKVKLVSKKFLEKPELKNQPFVKALLDRFSNPMNKTGLFARRSQTYTNSEYENVVQTRGAKCETLAKNFGKVVDATEKFLASITNPGEYKSAYSSEASWDDSCAKDPEACAVVFVGIAPMLYTGLHSLRIASKATTNKLLFDVKHTLGDVMKAVGYKEPGLRASISGSDVLKALEGVDKRVLDIIYDFSGFWAFY